MKKLHSYQSVKGILFIIVLFLLFSSRQLHAASLPQKNLKQVLSHIHHSICSLTAPGVAHCHAKVATNTDGTPLDTQTVFSGALGPAQLHGAYNLPCSPQGTVAGICATPSSYGPQTIAIVDAFHAPTIENDLHVYNTFYGLPECSKANGCLQILNQIGGSALPSTVDSGWAFETTLDIQIAHAMCQTCKILLIEANSSSILNLATAVNTAANLGVTAISNSYGSSEWPTEASYDKYYAHPGVAITASAGDNGYQTMYPASSPQVVGVGGTSLHVYTDNSYAGESVWSGTGSGCSSYEPNLSWQTALSSWAQTNCGNKRAVADIAAVADPNTGVAVYDSTPYANASGWWQVGGTSLASPIIASAYALTGGIPTNTQAGQLLYTAPDSSWHDIASGTNGTCLTIMCKGSTGYDGPSGLGTPDGLSGFSQLALSITPSPTSLPSPTTLPQPSPTPSPTPTPDFPSLFITTPTNGSIVPRMTNFKVSATVSDAVAITKVNFYRNNALSCSKTTAPYNCSMLTNFFANQTVNYKVTALNALGNLSTAQVSVKTQ